MRAFAAPRRILVNIAGSAETSAAVSCDSSGGGGIKPSFPARSHARTFPVHPKAVVLASRAEIIVCVFCNLDKLRRVNDTPGPFRAVIKVPT